MKHYTRLAKDLLKAYATGDSAAIRSVSNHFRLERTPSREEVREFVQQQLRHRFGSKKAKAILALTDAQYLVARSCAFESWQKLRKHVEAASRRNSPVAQFEAAVEAVITGDAGTLRLLLHKNPALIRARSERIHHSMLLHYTGANGVEGYRQKTPKNAVEILQILLQAGADVNALSDSYGKSTTLGLVATSIHPAHAGMHIALMETLLAAGATLDAAGSDVNACLANGRAEAAVFLARHGARLDFEGAAGVGRLDLVKRLFREATKRQIERGFMWASEYGHNPVLEFLMDSGFDPCTEHGGMTGLHWALVGGRLDAVKMLLKRNAPIDVKNAYGGTALGCATWAVMHSDKVYRWPERETDWASIIEALFAAGAKADEADYPTGNKAVDEVLRRHGAR